MKFFAIQKKKEKHAKISNLTHFYSEHYSSKQKRKLENFLLKYWHNVYNPFSYSKSHNFVLFYDRVTEIESRKQNFSFQDFFFIFHFYFFSKKILSLFSAFGLHLNHFYDSTTRLEFALLNPDLFWQWRKQQIKEEKTFVCVSLKV